MQNKGEIRRELVESEEEEDGKEEKLSDRTRGITVNGAAALKARLCHRQQKTESEGEINERSEAVDRIPFEDEEEIDEEYLSPSRPIVRIAISAIL